MKHEFIYKDENFIYYDPYDIDAILQNVSRETIRHKKVQYYNTANAFDIETSSFYVGEEKRACMYVWQLALEDVIIVGRTWKDFLQVIDTISKSLVLYKNRRLVIYIHNLPYEFQWFKQYFEWEEVFSIDTRKPLKAVTTSGIEFRCSLRLSGYALANLPVAGIRKLVGAMDYTQIRHNTTPLENNEMAYSIRDVQVVVKYIREKIQQDGNIAKIPMTKTGYVRLECRSACYGGSSHRDKQYKEYRGLMNKLTLVPPEYDLLKKGFQGGFTHGNPYIVRRCKMGINGKHFIENVGSFDITSSYPFEMVAENGYPMSKGKFAKTPISENKFKEYIDCYACVFDITFEGLEDIIHFDNPLSVSRCIECDKNTIANNGRVVSSNHVRTVITNIDFEILQACYTWKEYKVNDLVYYQRGYLPKPFIQRVLDFYKAKTQLKGETGEENERRYMWGKENVNATFGCTVTDPCRDTITYDNIVGWGSENVNIENALRKYNKNLNRFLFYPWGVFITAFARRRLWGLILACGYDYCYADTDSVKMRNPDKYKKFFQKSDEIATYKLHKAIEHYGFSWDDVAPKNKKGERKQLGLWEFEHVYRKFRTNGAKRYMAEYDNALEVDNVIYDLSLTVSGLNKRTAIPYLKEKYGSNEEIFKHFNTGIEIPDPYAGRTVSSYIDFHTCGNVVDYLGNVGKYDEKSSLHLENTSYTMNNSDFENFIAHLNMIMEITDDSNIIERKLNIE